MSGINFDYKGDYLYFVCFINAISRTLRIQYDIELTVAGKEADYSAAGIIIADNVNFTTPLTMRKRKRQRFHCFFGGFGKIIYVR